MHEPIAGNFAGEGESTRMARRREIVVLRSGPLLDGSEPGSKEEDADSERVVRDEAPHCEKHFFLRRVHCVGDQRRKVVKAPMKPTKTILRIFGSRSIRRSASASSSP